MADATGDAPFKYAVKEKLIVPSGPMLYYGRVLKRRAVDGALQYRVHFDGWHKRYDTWLSEEQCLADEPANVQLMEDFRKAQEAKEAARKPMPRGAAMREMWKGLVPSLWAVSHGAIQFSVYARFKRFYQENDGMGQGLLFHHHLGFGAASKICATVITYPLQMCRTRLQDHRLPKADQYRGMLDVMRTVVRTDGWFGFWRGIGPTILRVTPASAITLMMYEQVRLVLGLADS